MKKIIQIIAILLFSQYSFAQQNIGINTETPDSSAILDIESVEKGILIPRLTSLQRLAIDSPANSLMVFDLDESAIFYYSDSSAAWLKIPDKSEIYWNIRNNNIYNINLGNVGIGTDNPKQKLHIKGNGTSNPGLAISNGDSSYSIIIIIDELDGSLAWQGWSGLSPKPLLKIDSTGRVGVGTNPNSTLHLKSIDNNPTSLRFSNTGSNDIIIIIDELDGSIIVKDENNKELFTSDKLARFAIGKENAKNTLHIYSDTINPSIRLEREGYLFDYIFGFNENSSAFVLQRDSVIGGNSDILSVDTVGDVTINSSNKVNIFPGVKTGSIEVENEITGSSFTLSAHEDGTPFWVNGLNVMDMIGAYQDTFQLTDTDIHWAVRNHKGSSMSSAATNIVYIEIGEAGTYEVYYRVTVRGDANAFQFSEIELHKANGAGAYSYVANSQSNAPHPKLSPIPGGYEAFYNQVVHTRTMTLDLAAGDRLKLMGRTFGPTSIPLVYVNADGGEFIIRKLD